MQKMLQRIGEFLDGPFPFRSFTDNETYTEIDQGPISEPTIFKADRETGQFVKKWGANL